MQFDTSQLDPVQLDRYREDGFLVMPSLFDQSEVAALRAAFEADCAEPGPHRVLETEGDDVRALYASHQRRPEFAKLARSARLLAPVRQLLGSDAYVYQFKINAKPAFGGDRWAWHQDFPAWRLADNLPDPRLVNVGFFLDEVTEFNGPLIFLPGSHRAGQVRRRDGGAASSAQHLDPDDIAVGREELAVLVGKHGMAAPKGPAGSVVFFHPELVHGSSANMSPFPRKLLIVTYNDTKNLPRPLGEPRPDYLVGRDSAPLLIEDGPLVPAPEQVRA